MLRRVLHLIPDLGTGGAERMLVHLVVGLRHSPFTPEVVTLCGAEGTEQERRLLDAGVRLTALGKRPGFDPRMFLRIDRVLRERAPVLVHTHRPVLKYAWPSLRRRGIPAVHTVHNLAAQEAADAYGKVAQWIAFRTGVMPVAIGSEVASSIRRTYRVEPGASIPNGIPVADYRAPDPALRARWRQRNGIDERAVVFLCVARLAPQKNVAGLVSSFAALPGSPETILVVAGDGPERARIEELVATLGLGARVRLLGVRSDLRAKYAAADAFVLASHWEGHPLALMEAMAAGLPVVCTNVGSVAEVVRNGESGLLVPARDEAALTEAMRQLQTNANLRRDLGARAAEVASRRCDVAQMVEKYAGLYERVLGGRGPA